MTSKRAGQYFLSNWSWPFFFKYRRKRLSRYLRVVRLPPQDSERSGEARREITARKSPISSTNHQWGMKNPSLIEVSLYSAE
ncbi:hypothetical protein CN326_16165 [Bacillus sp. AFS018417]|nr:hypothetical protein CN326_16165 [Bacillus sp. AFS018417]